MLDDIIGPGSGMVNSLHQRSVEIVANGFRSSAYAPDGVIEAIEPLDPSAHKFILAVQWHPESVVDEPDTAFSLPIARRFMQAVHREMR